MKGDFTVRIATDNAAFQDADPEAGGVSARDQEVSWILDWVVSELSQNGLQEDETLRLRDINGNVVGEAFYEGGDAP
jgi:hypothetical protein